MRESGALAVDEFSGDGGEAERLPSFDPKVLLAAVATVLRDTIDRFGEVSGRVTENVLTRGNPADHSLIVALQDFDRLQQEFGALNDVLSRCMENWSGAGEAGNERLADGSDAIADISLADLKARLRVRAHSEALFLATQPANDEEF
jgi:hypothetical protein